MDLLKQYFIRRRNTARRLIPDVAALVILSCFASALAQSPQVRDAVTRGTAALREGRMADAEASFREVVRLAPDLAEVHLDLALLLAREGKMEEAIASLRKAIALNPKLPSAHLFLGIFLAQSNHPAEARTELEAELANDPNNVEALTWLGNLDLAGNKPAQAAASLDRAADLAPTDMNVLELKGRAHSQIARDAYARMAKIDPADWRIHKVQAELFAEGGQHAQAIKEYEAALKQQPRNPDLLEALGDEYRASSQLADAEGVYQKEMELAPNNPVAMYNVGSVAVELGDTKTAIPLLLKMNQAFPNAAVAQYYLGRAYAAEGQFQEAANWLDRSATADANSEIAKRSWYELARIYRKLQRAQDALHAQQEYSRISEQQQKQSAQQIQDWKKLTQAETP